MAGKIYRVPVISDEGEIVARVRYNTNLDVWDGHNRTSGGIGRHAGIVRLRNGSFVIIHGTDWQGERDSAEIISADEALQAILQADNDALLQKYFPKKATELDSQEEE